VVSAVRDPIPLSSHPLRSTPLFVVEKIAAGPLVPLTPSSVRVLDLTRVRFFFESKASF